MERKNPEYEWSKIKEGEVTLLVPSQAINQKEPPKFPAFFNPAAKYNRDISILIYRNFIDQSRKNISFVDSMCGLGARGVRVGKEIPQVQKVVFNDFNMLSTQTAKVNAIINNIYHKSNFYTSEICSFLSASVNFDNRATVIDLDPFGTPAPFLDCILRAVENDGMISITATDTAVLQGVYPRVCYRKYYGIPLRTRYSLEIGTRLLLSCTSLIASRLDLYINPIFAHSYRNYIRIYCKVSKSNYLANKISDKLGYILHCFECGFRELMKKGPSEMNCPLCQRKMRMGGPLWVSHIFDKTVIFKILAEILESETRMAKGANLSKQDMNPNKRFFEIASKELDYIPYHFDSDEFGKLMKNSTHPLTKIIEKLITDGYNASPTIFSPTGFKTEANLREIKSSLSNL
ncbi:tRNA (guanine(10)-N(2))-dimethyltransferase [soil metagenome]